MKTNIIENCDCLVGMKKLPDNYVDLLASDPPYGYSFMGKSWDTFNEVVEPQGSYQNEKGFKKLPRNKPNGMYEFMLPIWKECYRVMKPGAFAFVMCAPRQDVLSKQICALSEAGFRTDFTSIYWTYSSGFPKAHNIGKSVDKKLGNEREVIGRNKNSREKCDKTNTIYESGTVGKTDYITKGNSPLEGSYGGFQPKPAVEIVIICMKPLEKDTFVEQAMDNGKGVTWLDDCRMPYTETPQPFGNPTSGFPCWKTNEEYEVSPKGRFPANLLVSDDVLNDGVNRKQATRTYKAGTKASMMIDGKSVYTEDKIVQGSEGSYSRYFDLDKWATVNKIPLENNTFPFLICPKAAKKEKNAGCENIQEKEKPQRDEGQIKINTPYKNRPGKSNNSHPTVKPLKLMSYLITLGSREGDVVLDPFAGSGTTLLAAKNLKRNYIGYESEKEYFNIIEARLNYEKKTEHEFFG